MTEHVAATAGAPAPPQLHWPRIRALVRKESVQILRDPSSIIIAFVLPLLLLFLFGYGVSLDANRVRIGLVMEDTGPDARSLAASFTHSRFFDTEVATDRRAFTRKLKAGELHGMIVIPSEFSRLLRMGDTAPIQVLADGSEPNTAAFVQNYAIGVWRNWAALRNLEQGAEAPPGLEVEPRFWFNEELASRNFLVPGSIAIVMTLIGTLLTALVVAREWERGTMEALLATPVSARELLIGKTIPYFLLGLAAMVLCTLLAIFLFGVPFRGSVFALFFLSMAFLCPALGQGLLISAATKNQFVAAQIALFSGFLPAMLLSGFVFEIASMPKVIQWVSLIVPARYMVGSLQTVFLAGDIWPMFVKDALVMLAIGLVFFALALRVTQKRIG